MHGKKAERPDGIALALAVVVNAGLVWGLQVVMQASNLRQAFADSAEFPASRSSGCRHAS